MSQLVMITRLLFGLAICSSASASAPADVANLIYYESGKTTAHSSYAFAFALQADHTAHGLFSTGTGAGTFSDQTGAAGDYRWKYERVDDQTGTLTISADAEHPGSSEEVHGLKFSADDRGTRTSFISFGSFYLASPGERAPLANCSNRTFVAVGHSAFAGFVVTGDRPRAVLLRAAGPALTAFGVSDALSNPKLALSGHGAVTWQNDNWEQTGAESIRQTGTFVGAFPFATGSKDAALVAFLGPGDYVAEVSSAVASDSGQVLIEVYILP